MNLSKNNIVMNGSKVAVTRADCWHLFNVMEGILMRAGQSPLLDWWNVQSIKIGGVRYEISIKGQLVKTGPARVRELSPYTRNDLYSTKQSSDVGTFDFESVSLGFSRVESVQDLMTGYVGLLDRETNKLTIDRCQDSISIDTVAFIKTLSVYTDILNGESGRAADTLRTLIEGKANEEFVNNTISFLTEMLHELELPMTGEEEYSILGNLIFVSTIDYYASFHKLIENERVLKQRLRRRKEESDLTSGDCLDLVDTVEKLHKDIAEKDREIVKLNNKLDDIGTCHLELQKREDSLRAARTTISGLVSDLHEHIERSADAHDQYTRQIELLERQNKTLAYLVERSKRKPK